MENGKITGHISIEEVCEKRDYYVPIFAEGNPILKSILNYTLDKYLLDVSIAPFECCAGHGYTRDTFVMFNVKYGRDEYIHSIINAMDDMPGSMYALGQERFNNTINFSARMEYSDAFYANEFLRKIEQGLFESDKVKKIRPEVINMIKLLENVNLNNYQLILQKMSRKSYSAVLITNKGTPLVNRHPEFEQDFNLDTMVNLSPESFNESGIQRIIRMH